MSDVWDELAMLRDEVERLRTRYDSATDQAVRYADETERLAGLQQEIKKQSEEIERLWGERTVYKAEIERLQNLVLGACKNKGMTKAALTQEIDYYFAQFGNQPWILDAIADALRAHHCTLEPKP